ncbi:MAG: polysaccharide deacetylase family protein, partial [Phormidesmis sp.]
MSPSVSVPRLSQVTIACTNAPTLPTSSPVAFLPLDTAPSFTFKERLRRRLHLLSYQSGLSSLYARMQRESVATILMYHSVPPASEQPWIDPCNCISEDVFEQQMRFLSQYRQVISIERLTQKLKRKEPIKRGTVAITFDDGYRNNLTVAAPILAKYDLPATLYLATNYVST